MAAMVALEKHKSAACAHTNICPLQTHSKFLVYMKHTVFAEPHFCISSGFYSDCNFIGILLLLSGSSAPKPVAGETCWNGQTDQGELYTTAKHSLSIQKLFKKNGSDRTKQNQGTMMTSLVI